MREKLKILLVAVLFCMVMIGCSDNHTGHQSIEENEQYTEDKQESSVQKEQIKDDEPSESQEGFWVRYINVSQADAALVQCDGTYMLIDAGNKEDSRRIYSLIKGYGIEELELVVGSHAHSDHIGGLPGAYAAVEAKKTLCPTIFYDSEAFKDFAKYAILRGGGIVIPEAGDVYELGSAKVHILGLNTPSEEENDASIILKVVYGETSFLFTGDAELPAEEAVIKSGADLTATVLKVGHHGSDSSTSAVFLDMVLPRIAVISVGENEYGHPTEDVLERLDSAGAAIYRTDKNGDIMIHSDGKKVSVAVEKQASEEEIMIPGEVYQPDGKVAENGENGSLEQDYVVNKKSLKLHYPDCESVMEMKEENKLYLYGTREEVLSQGYDPCGACRP